MTAASPLRFAIVGAGMLGLTLAYRLRQAGHHVTVLEAAAEPGGQTGSWQLGPLTWDRYYHVIAQDDAHLLALLSELGLRDRLRWSPTKTGFYAEGRLYSLSSIAEFLRFPVIGLMDKCRLGLTLLRAASLKDLTRYEGETSLRWLTRWSGANTTRKIWSPLLQSKFGARFSELSAAFIIRTIQRMFGARRGRGKQEVFGYVEGGYATILAALGAKLEALGVETLLSCPVRSVMRDGDTIAVTLPSGARHFDRVILTAAPPQVARLCPGLDEAEKQRLASVEYLGIACASLLLEEPISPYYITNILDRRVPFTGVIEMSALVDRAEFGGHSLVYLPRYHASGSPELAGSEDAPEAILTVLEQMYPRFNRATLRAFRMSHLPYVLPVPTAQLQEHPLPVRLSVPGVFMLGTGHITDGVLTVNKMMALAEASLAQCLADA